MFETKKGVRSTGLYTFTAAVPPNLNKYLMVSLISINAEDKRNFSVLNKKMNAKCIQVFSLEVFSGVWNVHQCNVYDIYFGFEALFNQPNKMCFL